VLCTIWQAIVRVCIVLKTRIGRDAAYCTYKLFEKIPEFYREVVKCWNLSGGGQTQSPVTFIDIRKQIIWGNKYITFENKSIVFENWIKSDLINVNDILDSTKFYKANSFWKS
jgi:hypothetical protein